VDTRLDDTVVKTLKALAMDAVQQANSGHPGMPMGMADTSAELWLHHLVVDPSEPSFPDRDRFILSAGHGSMLIYGLLHLSGHDVSLDDIRNFRQLHSKTPGHPEVGMTSGVETTTGPLGQGFATGVGMAMAAERLGALFNRPGFPVVDHGVYAIVSDGDLQEGISHEAASLAGHLGLGRLVYLWDDNRITIDGSTDLSFTEDVAARFESYGWHVLKVDGHDRDAVGRAIEHACGERQRPSLIQCRTHIGHGSRNKQDTASSHGSPLGHDEIRLTKEAMGWPVEPTFHVPADAHGAFDGLRARGRAKREGWEAMFASYSDAHPELARAWGELHDDDGLPQDLEAVVDGIGDGDAATRGWSGKIIAALAEAMPALWGGSADLGGSNKTLVPDAESFQRNCPDGRNLHFGVREHAMAAIANGMALHGGVIPYCATFLTFSDYMRGAMRLSALMKQRVIYVLSHDSIFLGEDGPTHQSVEHAMALRLIPDMHVYRPADGRETAAAWLAALRRTDGPSCLLLTRQSVPAFEGSKKAVEGVARGGYVVREEQGGRLDLVLVGTGSELQHCQSAADILSSEGVGVRVVSMPSVERFLDQDASYRDAVLPPDAMLRVTVEAGRTWGWERIAGPMGACIGIDRFGESAPAGELAALFGFTHENVLQTARGLLASSREQAAQLTRILESL